MDRNFVIATVKKWNIDAFYECTSKLQGNFYLFDKRDDLTLNRLKEINPDFIFFPHWSWIVPSEILNHYTCVCFHMTDLPYGRGGSPLQNLIARGHSSTKLTALKMTENLDAGPIYKKLELDLSGSAEQIYLRASKLVYKLIEYIISNTITPKLQQGEPVYFERRKPEQSLIPENIEFDKLYDLLRMLDAETYPKAFIEFDNFNVSFDKVSLENGKIISRATFHKRELA